MDARLKAFLDLIAWSEGTSTSQVTRDNGYDVVVSGVDGPATFPSYADHPFAGGGSVLVRLGPPPLHSTAAGRYQLLARYWAAYKAQLALPDFSPASQDAVAIQQMRERGVTAATLAAQPISAAITACAGTWASFPGNAYGQGGKSLAALDARYAALLT